MGQKTASLEHSLRQRLDRVTGESTADAVAQAPAATAGNTTGHDASRPTEIPRQGWWAIAKRTVMEANEDRVMTEAAGITFYALLSLFPGLTALVSLYGLFADRATMR